MLELDEALQSEQAIHNHSIVDVDDGESVLQVIGFPITSDRWAGSIRKAPPSMGADTVEILTRIGGMDSPVIDNLVSIGAIGIEGDGNE